MKKSKKSNMLFAPSEKGQGMIETIIIFALVVVIFVIVFLPMYRDYCAVNNC